MRTATRDTSSNGFHYFSGLLRMEAKRDITHIAQTAGIAEQNMQQFISDSPWSGYDLIAVLQQDIGALPHFQEGAVLLGDESAEEKAGAESAGASRQHNGRLGKVEMSQVGVFLSLTKNGYRTWIDGELFLAKKWFSDAYAQRRKRVGLPPERTFQTKLELLLVMVKRTQANGVPFEALDCDTLYGRSGWVHHLALTIMASVFITETLLDWAEKYPPDPALLEEYGTDNLPKLSIGNVRELLRAAMPLPQLTPLQAAELVVKHLDNRNRSRKSRLQKARSP